MRKPDDLSVWSHAKSEDHTNGDRARYIGRILAATTYSDNEPATAIGDLLADVMHYCDLERISFGEAVRMGHLHHDIEVVEQGLAQ